MDSFSQAKSGILATQNFGEREPEMLKKERRGVHAEGQDTVALDCVCCFLLTDTVANKTMKYTCYSKNKCKRLKVGHIW